MAPKGTLLDSNLLVEDLAKSHTLHFICDDIPFHSCNIATNVKTCLPNSWHQSDHFNKSNGSFCCHDMPKWAGTRWQLQPKAAVAIQITANTHEVTTG